MNVKKTTLRIGFTLGALAIVVGLLYLLIAITDGKLKNPARHVVPLTTAKGERYWQINTGVNNSYLLPCQGGYLLVDTGYPEDYERFQRALAAKGLALESIRWLFITHDHDEHAGFAAALRADTGCRLIVPKLSIPSLERGRWEWHGKAVNPVIETVAGIYNTFKQRSMEYPSVKILASDIVLEGGSSSFPREIGIEGEFLATPGHSPDSWTLLLDDGQAFCGDAAMNFLNALGAGYRPAFVTEEEAMYSSLELLRARGAIMILSGHGEPFSVDKLPEKSM